MKGLLVRVGADQSAGGGHWNGPVDARTGDFVYVAIPETEPLRKGMEKSFCMVEKELDGFGWKLPPLLVQQHMHLDPDFGHLTYGDHGQRARQIADKLGPGDLLVFYAGLKDVRDSERLVYAIIGLYVIEDIVPAVQFPASQADINAHTRRLLKADAGDIVVHARVGVSGRLGKCLSMGEFRDLAYRVQRDLLEKWGGLTVRDGYLQRSARLPELKDADRFYSWFMRQNPELIERNN